MNSNDFNPQILHSIKRLNCAEVYEKIKDDPQALLLDVRDKMEAQYIGYPTHSICIPWRAMPNWEINPHFLEQVEAVLTQLKPSPDIKQTPLYLLCRSGKRSFDAAYFLATYGFENLTNIEKGFEGDLNDHKHRSTINGWRFDGLPWEQN